MKSIKVEFEKLKGFKSKLATMKSTFYEANIFPVSKPYKAQDYYTVSKHRYNTAPCSLHTMKNWFKVQVQVEK